MSERLVQKVISGVEAAIQLGETTAQFPADPDNADHFGVEGNATYCLLGLLGEAGEVANKIKKIIRGDFSEVSPEVREAIQDELFDVLWYFAMLMDSTCPDIAAVVERGYSRLRDRQLRGAIKGSGDQR